MRRVIDISGDGPNNNGAPVTGARDEALEKGIIINGLPIMVKEPSYSTMDIDNLDWYYEDCVIGGPGSFVVSIKDRDKFKEAIRTKLLLEVAGRTPERRIVPVAEKEPRVSCLIGEKIWQDAGAGENRRNRFAWVCNGAERKVQRIRVNRATSSTCGVWRNWSTGVTPSIL